MSTDTFSLVRRGPIDLTARWFLTVHVYLAAWFWAIATVMVAVGLVVLAQVRSVDASVAVYARQAAIWFPFAVFITLVFGYLPMHIASGLTRRVLSLGSLVAAVGTSVLYGVTFTVLLVVERAVFDAAGWEWSLGDQLDAGGTGALLVRNVLTFLVAYLSGLLAGITYLRSGGWGGTLTLPLTVGPILVVSAVFDRDAWPYVGLGAAVLVALVVAAAMAFAYDRLVRGAAVPRRG